MKFLNNALGYIGKGAVALIVGYVVLFVAVAGLVGAATNNMEKGLGVSLKGTQVVVVFIGGCLSYVDNLFPDLSRGKELGDRALGEKTT